jgi:hypothetical protein
MKRRLLLYGLALSLSVAVRESRAEEETGVKELEATIRKELPTGTSRSDVIGFLQRQKIAYHDSADIAYFKGPRTVWGLSSRRSRSRVFVIDTILTFEFDPQDRLVSYSRREQTVGP